MFPVRPDRGHPIAGAVVAACVALTASPAGAELAGHGGSVKSVSISDDGRYAASASFDNRLILWNIDAQSELRDFDAAGVSFEHDGLAGSVGVPYLGCAIRGCCEDSITIGTERRS